MACYTKPHGIILGKRKQWTRCPPAPSGQYGWLVWMVSWAAWGQREINRNCASFTRLERLFSWGHLFHLERPTAGELGFGFGVFSVVPEVKPAHNTGPEFEALHHCESYFRHHCYVC